MRFSIALPQFDYTDFDAGGMRSYVGRAEELGVAVLVTSQHEPLQLASAVTTVDRISHGRLDIGVASGRGGPALAAFGVEKDTFISYFTEGLKLMKAAWSDQPTVAFASTARCPAWTRFRCRAHLTTSPAGWPR